MAFTAHTTLAKAENTEEIILSVKNAYGGEALTQASGLKIRDRYKALYTDQGLSHDFTEVYKNNVELSIDLKNQRKSLTEWEQKWRGERLTQIIFDGQLGRVYDLFHGTYDNNDYFDFHTIGTSVTRSHDTLLALMLWQQRHTATYIGERELRTHPHFEFKVKTSLGQEMNLLIHKKTRLISKAIRYHDYFGEIAYVFSNHSAVENITLAKDLQINVAGEPVLISVSRDIELNPSLETAFIPPSNSRFRGETIDASEMSIRTLAENVYFVGQGYQFSLFIDVGPHFVGVGGNYGLGARFSALQENTSSTKPLKYQIASHHHSDHLEGMVDAAKLGAKFITVAQHVDSIQKALLEPLPTESFILMSGKKTLADGMVEIYEMASTHSDQNLLVYVPKAKVLFVADHFSTDLKSALPHVDKGTVILRKEINKLNIEVDKFVSAHGSRILTYSDLVKVADSYSELKCPTHIPVCE